MHEETVSTGTAISTHPGKDTGDAIARARKQMDEQLAERCDKWNSSPVMRDRDPSQQVRAHVVALSCTPTVEAGWPYAHIVYSYELRCDIID